MKAENQVVICAIAKQEYDFLVDWVKWHLRIGFDKIYIYDNNEVNGERYDELLKEWIDKDQVQLIDVRGRRGIQDDCYNKFYNEYTFKWVMYIDIDEFVYLKPTGKYLTIRDFLKMKKDADSYTIFWECYGARDHDIKGPVWEHCEKLPDNVRKIEENGLNWWHKSIIRSGLDIEVNEHIVVKNTERINMYDANGNKISSQLQIFYTGYQHHCEDICINHYILRDINTFFYKKYLRGHAGQSNDAGTDGFIANAWMQNINYFTDIQKHLNKKEQDYLYSKGFRENWKFFPTLYVIAYILPGDPTWAKLLSNNINQLHHISDTLATVITDHDLQEDEERRAAYDNDEEGHKGLYNYDRMLNYSMWDTPGQISLNINKSNYFIQEPLVLHIGYSIDEHDISIEHIQNFINNIIVYMRDLCFFHQGESIMYTPKALVQYDESDNLYIEDNKKEGIPLYHKRLLSNVFLTNASTYSEIYNLYSEQFNMLSNETNASIRDNNRAGYATPYNKFNFLWPGLVKNIIEV